MAATMPSVMLLFARPLVSISASRAADVVPMSTTRALATTSLPVLVSVSTSMLSAITESRPPAVAVPPLTLPPAMITVSLPEVSEAKAPLPVPVTVIALPAFTVPNEAFPPKLTLNASPAVALSVVTVSALIVIEPSVAVDCMMFADVPPLIRISPWSAMTVPAIVPVTVASVTLSLACAVPIMACAAFNVMLLRSLP